MRPLDEPGSRWTYKKGEVLGTENRDLEFKSFAGASLNELPKKVVEKAVVFITGCLNSRVPGVICFGVADEMEQNHKFSHGEVIGLNIGPETRTAISNKINEMLDNSIRTYQGGEPLSVSEKRRISLHFIDVRPRSSSKQLCVVEVQVVPKWINCEGRTYMCKTKSSSDFKAYVRDLIGMEVLTSLVIAQYSKEIQTEYNEIVELKKEGKRHLACMPFSRFV